MGIPYDPLKPATNNRPTNDQPIMQSNFASLKTLIDVDHTDFSSPYYGEHDQVTFSSNNVPGLPTPLDASGNNQGVLFTQAPIAGVKINQLFYYAGNATETTDVYDNSGANGSTMLLGGIIMKWGSFASAAGGGLQPAVAFTKKFPNACFNVQLTFQSAAAGFPGLKLTATPTVSGFTVDKQNVSPLSPAGTIYWVAIGN